MLAKFWQKQSVLDRFDLQLLNLVQQDDSRTADSLAKEVPLSPSAIARRLRRLRSEGRIARSIARLGRELTESRLRAFVFIELSDHTDLASKTALEHRLVNAAKVQFCYETSGEQDLVALLDCTNMGEFNQLCDELLGANSAVRRYVTSFVKREIKFAPFLLLSEASASDR